MFKLFFEEYDYIRILYNLGSVSEILYFFYIL